MKAIRSLLLVSTVTLLSFTTGKADDLLDSVLKSPGGFDQMCSISIVEPGVPIPLFHQMVRQEIYVSDKNMTVLHTHRADVVPGLVHRIEAFDTEKGAPQFTALYYKIIPRLDAIETLPALLRIEDRIHGSLAQAGDGAEPPESIVHGKMDAAVMQRDPALSGLRIEQRELLSVMLQLLRGQAYQPLLDSDFEKKYEEVIKARAKKDEALKDITTLQQAEQKGYRFDLICHVPVGFMGGSDPSVPYTDKARAQIRDLAAQFLKDVPPEKWKVNAE